MSSDNGHSKNEEREDCLISQLPQSAMSPSTSRSPAQCIPVDGEMVSSQTSLVEGPGSHGHLVLTTWEKLMGIVGKDSIVSSVLIDGHSVDIASVVAVARARASIDGKLSIAEDIQASVVFLQRHLEEGHSVYGVTTGFGGSADTRTSHTAALQRGLLQHHLAGILPGQGHDNGSADSQWHEPTKPNGDQLALLAMPEAWVRGAMLVRANSLVRGHSAVRLSIIKNLVELLDRDLVPLVPLRGSISASGDLTPLCYIAGALDGNPDIKVWAGEGKGRKLVQANKALELAGLKRIELRAKEGLGILNGTAFSAAVASLAIYEANNLAVLSQVLTSMGVEALQGTAGSFDPFIAKVRPHQGQVEAARNIFSFLGGSSLADSRRGDQKDGALRQDRYALRTSSQWIGPQLEDLELAHKQLQVELNSTTDNPLIDPSGCHVHHGGNFQAAVVTSSTEKTRSALQMLGKMLFAQCTELLDVTRNNGLPPNLAPDDPSLSYLMKGVDINMASYMAELAFLSNPVSSHVQSAEMGNQAINSMALVSARYTHMAVDMVSLMCSAYLYCLCHALDLRAMQAQFEEKLLGTIEALTIQHLDMLLPSQGERRLAALMWSASVAAFAALGLLSSTASAISTLSIKGSKFFDGDGNQFYIKGIAYQRTPDDPLIDGDQCKLDAKGMKDVGANTIRVYHVDPSADHKSCMQTFADNGIYLFIDLDTFTTQIEQTGPHWNQSQLTAFTKVLDEFSQFDNTAGVFVGNEVITTEDGSNAAPYVKAATRDVKSYRDSKNMRKVPVGYSAADISQLRPMLQNYLACGGNDTESIDFFGLNAYEWCGPVNYQTSGYEALTVNATDSNIPIFFSETGCHTNPPRTFDDQAAIFGDKMNDIWSGAIVYEWINEANEYGLINYGPMVDPSKVTGALDGYPRSGSPTPMSPDYTNLKSQWATLSPSGIKMSDYTSTKKAPACPTATPGIWNVDGSVALPSIGQTATKTKSKSSSTASGTSASSPSGASAAASPSQTKSGSASGGRELGAMSACLVGVMLGFIWWL
ncbi:MAG: hypothetical protein M4579_000321 [Chaenotheca gracillima]|nr:MAG: hypothetical protein M4579_000321 [Chaenotheca gracillima]